MKKQENNTQQNGMMLAELKQLKATLVLKDKRIKELEAELKATNTVTIGPFVEVKPQL